MIDSKGHMPVDNRAGKNPDLQTSGSQLLSDSPEEVPHTITHGQTVSIIWHYSTVVGSMKSLRNFQNCKSKYQNTDAFKSTSYFTACVNFVAITVQNAVSLTNFLPRQQNHACESSISKNGFILRNHPCVAYVVLHFLVGSIGYTLSFGLFRHSTKCQC